ncbi:MAG TPA: LysR substrate-binding domain-containing protein, partial [Devosia sp.]|nr:LysR substrate-binding domain-containing protein [Devosia sp.]
GMIARAGIDAEKLDIAMVLPGNEAVLGVVEAGLGATLVSRAVARARVVAGLLSVVDLPMVQRNFYLLRHKERYRTKAAEAFLAMVGSAEANG